MSNISCIDKNKCTGCMCCVNKCPKNAIKIVEDEEGFLYPQVEKEKCINCSLCTKCCQALQTIKKYTLNKAYAAQIKSEKDLKDSSSGGVAYELSKNVIENSGVAYGAIFDKNLKVIHSRATTIEELKLQQGSKYVQSNINGIYKSIKKDCESGIEVIFIGTPCQVAGIKLFLNKEYDNLLLVDLICHGVPNQKLFNEYIAWKEKKIKNKIIKYSFRDKKNGWGTNIKIDTKNNRILYGHALTEPYYSDFIDALNYRNSCYECKYTTKERVSDITIGDYWGIEKIDIGNKFDISKGVSCIIMNTKKGLNSFNNIKTECFCIETDITNVINNNSNLKHPVNRNILRDNYYKNIEKEGMKYSKKMLYKKKSFYIRHINNLIPKRIKKILKGLKKRK